MSPALGRMPVMCDTRSCTWMIHCGQELQKSTFSASGSSLCHQIIYPVTLIAQVKIRQYCYCIIYTLSSVKEFYKGLFISGKVERGV